MVPAGELYSHAARHLDDAWREEDFRRVLDACGGGLRTLEPDWAFEMDPSVLQHEALKGEKNSLGRVGRRSADCSLLFAGLTSLRVSWVDPNLDYDSSDSGE